MDPVSFFKKAKNEHADPAFLKSLRKDLVQYMEAYPQERVAPARAGEFAAARGLRWLTAVPAMAGLVAIFAIGGTVFAAQGSLPGSPLYPVKLLSEQVQLATTLSPQARSAARLSFAAKRIDEITELAGSNANGMGVNSSTYHDAAAAALANFNAQVAGAFAEARDLQEKNNTTGSLTITNEIKSATDGYETALTRGVEQGNDDITPDINQFVAANNDFSARAAAVLQDANGTAATSSPKAEHGNDLRGRSDNGSNHPENAGRARSMTNGTDTINVNNDVPLNDGSAESATNAGAQGERSGDSGRGGGHGGNDGNSIIQQSITTPQTSAPVVLPLTPVIVATTSPVIIATTTPVAAPVAPPQSSLSTPSAAQPLSPSETSPNAGSSDGSSGGPSVSPTSDSGSSGRSSDATQSGSNGGGSGSSGGQNTSGDSGGKGHDGN
jgi:hypothetical protein